MLIKTTKVKDVLEFFIKLIYMYYKSSHFKINSSHFNERKTPIDHKKIRIIISQND